MEVSLRRAPGFWVVAPGRARSLLQTLPSDLRLEWCYLGSNASMSEKAARNLGPARRIFIAEELTAIAHELKGPFVDWVAEMGQRQKDKVNWWASRLASKSPLQTDFFHLVCYSRLVQRWVEEQKGSGVLELGLPTPSDLRIVIVEDPWLRWVLRRRLADNASVRFHGGHLGRCLIRAMYWLGRAPLAMGLMFVSSIWDWVRSRLFAGQRVAPHAARGPSVLIYTWIDQKSFSVPEKIQDAHTGRLEEILRSQGETVLRLTPLAIRGTLLRALRRLSPMPVMTSCWIRILDVILSLFAWFRINGLKGLGLFQGCDYKPLLYRELLFEWGSTSFPGYHLWYRTMRRVAREVGRNVKCLIYPFENQPWEKLMCLAWREEARHVQLIGYQHSRVPPLLLPYALGATEAETLPLPDRIVTNGEATLESLRAAGFPDSKLANGGALRYEYFYSGNGSAAPEASEPLLHLNRRVVLVAFPLSRPHCRGLLVDLLDEFEEPLFVDDRESVAVQLVLKCHPWLPLERFYPRKVILPPWMSFSEESMEKELARADLLLYVPSTTSWREAYVAGVPVLKYEVDLLDIDPPAAFNGFSVYPCRKETLRSMIRKLVERPPAKHRPPAEVLGKIFGRVDEGLWTRIVQRGGV